MKKILRFVLALYVVAPPALKAQCPFTTSVIPNGSTNICGSSTLVLTATASVGNTWTQKHLIQDMRRGAAAFTIGNKGYFGTGESGNTGNYMSDFFEYDPATDAWTQKANFLGGARTEAVGFSLNGFGYIGTGFTSNTGDQFDMWQYDPVTNTWVQAPSFGGTPRRGAACFVIGSSAYVGSGYGASSGTKYDLWEFNGGGWTQKANLGGTPGWPRLNGIGFSIGTKGYFGLGQNGTSGSGLGDVWEYSPATNTWTQKNSFPGGKYSAVSLTIGSKAYVIAGMSSSNSSITGAVWEYNPIADTWAQKTAMAPGRADAFGFAVGNMAYVGGGFLGTTTTGTGDFWQYEPSPTYAWSSGQTTHTIAANLSATYVVTVTSAAGCSATASQTVAINPTPVISVNSGSLCSGQVFTISPSGANTYTITGNSFTVSPAGNTSYSVTGTSTAGCNGNTAVSNITVNPTPTISVNSGAICSGKVFTISPSGASTYTASGGSFTVSPIINTSYSITGTSAFGCAGTNTAVASVTVQPVPVVNASSSSSLICPGATVSLTASGALSYNWNNGQSSAVTIVSPTTSTSYTVTGTNATGCSARAVIAQSVAACTGVSENTFADHEVRFFPNPTNGIITITFASEGLKEITVYDGTGRKVASRLTENILEQFDFSVLSKGIYVMSVNNKNGRSHSRIIVQ